MNNMSNVCETHIVLNCPICAKKAPVAAPVFPPASGTPAIPNPATNAPAPPPPATPSDPHAAKIVAAANGYAAACDNYKSISDEVKTLEEKITDAKKRLATASTKRDTAQAELVKLMGEKQ